MFAAVMPVLERAAEATVERLRLPVVVERASVVVGGPVGVAEQVAADADVAVRERLALEVAGLEATARASSA